MTRQSIGHDGGWDGGWGDTDWMCMNETAFYCPLDDFRVGNLLFANVVRPEMLLHSSACAL